MKRKEREKEKKREKPKKRPRLREKNDDEKTTTTTGRKSPRRSTKKATCTKEIRRTSPRKKAGLDPLINDNRRETLLYVEKRVVIEKKECWRVFLRFERNNKNQENRHLIAPSVKGLITQL